MTTRKRNWKDHQDWKDGFSTTSTIPIAIMACPGVELYVFETIQIGDQYRARIGRDVWVDAEQILAHTCDAALEPEPEPEPELEPEPEPEPGPEPTEQQRSLLRSFPRGVSRSTHLACCHHI